MTESNQKATRLGLYESIHNLDLDDTKSLLDIQLRLADAILDGESNGRQPTQFDRHTFLLRRCQDALAFRLLVPHAIRQLLGTASPKPHSLAGQGQAFNVTRDRAKSYAEQGHQVLLADLSHVIRLGDIIVCDNPFVPSIIEVKAGVVRPENILQGRRGRQASRSGGTVEYLKTDAAKIYEQALPKVAVQSKEAMHFSWDCVNEVALSALRDGEAVVHVSDFDVLLGIHAAGGRPVTIDRIMDSLARMRSPLIASHAFALLNPELLIRPPIVWPIDNGPLIPLMEEELILLHAIDLERFKDPLEEGFQVLAVSHASGFSTERHGERGTAASRFIDDALFGYATIESVVSAMRELHDLAKIALQSQTKPPAPKALGASAIQSEQLEPFSNPVAIMDTKEARYKIAPIVNKSETGREGIEPP